MIIVAERKVQKQKKRDEEMIYCGNWKCTIYDCERHHLRQPWNVPIRTRNWEPKKGNKCDGLR